jgi:hypothetical protein
MIGWNDLKACFTEGDVEACLWTAASLIPWSKLGPVAKAFFKVAKDIGKFLKESSRVKKAVERIKDLLKLGEKACEKLDKVPVAAGRGARTGALAVDDGFPFHGCVDGVTSLSHYTKQYMGTLSEIAQRYIQKYPELKNVSGLGQKLWSGADQLTDLQADDPAKIAQVLASVRGMGVSKADLKWLQGYFGFVAKVSKACNHASPAAPGRARLLANVLKELG